MNIEIELYIIGLKLYVFVNISKSLEKVEIGKQALETVGVYNM